MNRDDVLLIGFGGAGNNLTDTIKSLDSRFVAYFINSSMTDLQTLENYNEVDKNYLCVSNQNGTGRDRRVGKTFAGNYGETILDIIQRYSQKTIFFATSLGGGSGSSLVSVILNGISQITKDKDSGFDKIINVIGILPKLDSPNIILKNTLETWNEIMGYSCVNNVMFIDNNNLINGSYLSEDEINVEFAKQFNSIFDIPLVNGRNFDNGNLSRIINSKGCTYFYNLPSGHETFIDALKVGEKTSVLSRMYVPKDIIETVDGVKKIKVGYVGASFNDSNYTFDEVLNVYKPLEDKFDGYNEETNMLIISGALPPVNSIKLIGNELTERVNNKTAIVDDFSKFTVGDNLSAMTVEKKTKEKAKENPQQKNRGNVMKKILKKNLFDSFK